MDPDAALAACRAALAEYRQACDDDHEPRRDAAAAELADGFEALDGWLTAGGFRPAAWIDPGLARARS